MAKVTLSRILETSRALATESGQELKDFIEYVSQLAELSLRCLRNGLNYTDNFDCLTKTVSFRSGVAQAIEVGSKRPSEVRPRTITDSRYSLAKPLAWSFNTEGQFVVTAEFSPAPTAPVSMDLLILFG